MFGHGLVNYLSTWPVFKRWFTVVLTFYGEILFYHRKLLFMITACFPGRLVLIVFSYSACVNFSFTNRFDLNIYLCLFALLPTIKFLVTNVEDMKVICFTFALPCLAFPLSVFSHVYLCSRLSLVILLDWQLCTKITVV
jgi:hypothetical protein